MSNEEFDNLKEELLWEGSRVAVLEYGSSLHCRLRCCMFAVRKCEAELSMCLIANDSKDEQRFMEASMAYSAGKKMMSDDDFDNLKKRLKRKNSKVVSQVGSGSAATQLAIVFTCSPHWFHSARSQKLS